MKRKAILIVYKDSDGKWYSKLKAINGVIVWSSAFGYWRKSHAVDNARALLRAAKNAILQIEKRQ